MHDETHTPTSADLIRELMAARAGWEPLFDAADGMRLDLEARGWSPVTARWVAGQWMCHIVRNSVRGGR
ncbi:hypothetical protein [Streptomyces sp. CAU 1734]|uniref:hypothetical protein n=1 Tax=Streptomyces sp. CAU 1734 TaxID=3140360 RepID=UPI003261934E